MKHLVIVGSHPPSKQGLNEYTDEITQSINEVSDTKITVLCDTNEGKDEYHEGNVSIVPFWDYNDIFASIKIAREIRKTKPDVVWLNLLYSTFGDKSVPAMLGLLLPLFLKMSGIRCVSTLHHIAEFIELGDSKFKYFHGILRLGMNIATRLILKSSVTTVTMQKYKDVLDTKYPNSDVVRLSHGFIGNKGSVQAPLTGYNMLVFGKFGSYKKVEPAIEILDLVKEQIPEARLVVAGGDHPNYRGYIESVKEKYENRDDIDFLGYVPDEKMDEVFVNSDLMLQPYTSTTGISGVSHLAISYGLPIVCPDLPDFVEGAKEEDYQIITYDQNSVHKGVELICWLFQQRSNLQIAGQTNFEKAKKNSIFSVAAELCRILGLETKELDNAGDKKRQRSNRVA